MFFSIYAYLYAFYYSWGGYELLHNSNNRSNLDSTNSANKNVLSLSETDLSPQAPAAKVPYAVLSALHSRPMRADPSRYHFPERCALRRCFPNVIGKDRNTERSEKEQASPTALTMYNLIQGCVPTLRRPAATPPLLSALFKLMVTLK